MGGSEISRSEEKSFENNDVFVWISKKIQEPLKAEFKKLRTVKEQQSMIKPVLEIETTHDEEREEEKLEKQLQAWRDNPSWIDQPPNVQVKSQNGLFCHLNAEFNVGLPPKSVYKIFTHPDNKRYFKNIKECISRKVLMEDGPMQTVEVKQAAAWKFLWWAGTFPIHLIVQENRKHLMSNYKQEKTMFMKVFEGCWRVEPLFIDEHLCERLKPKTQEDYDRCTNGRGRIGSKVTMDQMFQPSAILTPPPLSWYIRGITTKTTESMIEDLLAEAARIRGGGRDDDQVRNCSNELDKRKVEDIKDRWRSRRRRRSRDLRVGPWYFNPAASPKEKAEIMKIDHVRSMSVYPTDPKYYDLAELWRQVRLWRSENSKHPWYDAPAKVKMKTKKGLCHLNIDFTLGWPPQAVYEMFTNPRNLNFFHSMASTYGAHDTIATMVLKKDGPRQITEVEKVLRWKILGYNGAIPIHVIIDENHQKVTGEFLDRRSFLDGFGKFPMRERIVLANSVDENLVMIQRDRVRPERSGRAKMVFPGFGGWINQNIQQPLKTSKRSKNGKSRSASEEEDDRYLQGPWYWVPDLSPKEKAQSLELDHVKSMPLMAIDPKYYDMDELVRQNRLWNSEHKKHPWNDAPAKVKVKTRKGICHLNIDFTLGSPPQSVFQTLTDPRNMGIFHSMGKYKNNWRTHEARYSNVCTNIIGMEILPDLNSIYQRVVREEKRLGASRSESKEITVGFASTKRSEKGKSSSFSEKDRYLQGPWYWNPAITPKEKAESMEIDHVKSMPLYATDPKYYDLDELVRQVRLWMSENKKHPWHDEPAKVKVKTKEGICHLNINFTLGWPPQAVFEMFTDPRNMGFFHSMGKYKDHFRTRLDTIATKVIKKDGPRQITEVEKVLRWKILGYNGTIPIHVIIDENHQKVTTGSKRSEDDKSKSESPKESNNMELYHDSEEEDKQIKLWNVAERKHPWYDPPPKVKVTTKRGICHMNIEFTLGVTPLAAFENLRKPMSLSIDMSARQLLKNKSRKVLKKDGPREILETENTVAFDFLGWSGAFPIKLIVDENIKDLTAKYKKEKMMFMKVFEGSYKVEPIFVDSERLCKHRLPKTREEYKKCSGGQGKIASKVIMNQYFQPSPPFNLPPFSWYINGITIRTTKTLLQMIELSTVTFRELS
ncbi:unnamed protein product [Brassica rapa subsp. trilocularis]